MGATVFSAIKTGTVSVDPGSIADQSRGSVTFTLTGLAVGDLVVLNPPATLNVGLAYAGCAVAANTVTIFLYNASGGAIDDAATTWTYWWWDATP